MFFKVVPHGRSFVRRMIDMLSVTKVAYHHHIRLNKDFRSDLAWWKMFVDTWNGVSLLQLTKKISPFCECFHRCLREFWLWSHLGHPVVTRPVANRLASGQYYGQGTCACYPCLCLVGYPLDRATCTVQIDNMSVVEVL